MNANYFFVVIVLPKTKQCNNLVPIYFQVCAYHRNRASVYRDISELERFGLVKTHEEINPGHGRHKIVELVASKLRLEAYI